MGLTYVGKVRVQEVYDYTVNVEGKIRIESEVGRLLSQRAGGFAWIWRARYNLGWPKVLCPEIIWSFMFMNIFVF